MVEKSYLCSQTACKDTFSAFPQGSQTACKDTFSAFPQGSRKQQKKFTSQ